MKAKQRIPNRRANAALAAKAPIISLSSKRLSYKSLLSGI
jgi:hypothetical protein